MPEIIVPYQPRVHFAPFHSRSSRFACMVAHRRAGKTVACVNELIARAIYSKKKRPRYGYIGPFINQAKKIAWEYLKEYSDGLLAKKANETELTVRLAHNGAEISIYGADNPDRFRGLYFDGVILDEFGDMAPSIWTSVLLPALSDRQGWAVFIGTPKGKNHFFQIYNRARTEPGWYHFMLKASESGVLPATELALQRREQGEDEYLQEYECSFDAAVKGTYYAKLVAELEGLGRINSANASYDPECPVQVAMDLGFTDSTALWYWQERPDGVALIDYDEANSEPLRFYFDLLNQKGYKYSTIWLPHDARAKTLQTGVSTIQQFLMENFPVRIAPELRVQDGINVVRRLLPYCWFSPRCANGVEALRAYHRKWDEVTKSFNENPADDWSSHGADAFRYLCLVARERIVAPQAEPKAIVVRSEPITLEGLWKERDQVLRLTSRRIG
jgi:phage terminase large subunit